jgi:hypothetical protein
MASTGRSTTNVRGGRLPEWVVACGVGLVVAVIMTIPFLQAHEFYYRGDSTQSFVPLWHHFGEALRAGRWPTMEEAGWYGGNYAAEGAYALWNPVELLDYVVVSMFDDLAAGAAFVAIQFLALLGIGTYLLIREYGSHRFAAIPLAVAIPASGFTLFYEASGWPAGLMAFTWVTWFWWAARRHARGRLWPVAPFLIGALGMTTGNPYAALGMVVVLTGIAVELLVARSYRRLGSLVLMGACVGATAALVFLPLLGTLSVTDRDSLAVLANDGFLVPHLSDIIASSAPTYLPPILNWGNALFEQLPSTYFVWFATPLLPWVRWRALRHGGGSARDRSLISLLVITVIFGALTVGPSNVWLFRWPIRFIEYFYLCLAILLAFALSRGLAQNHIRRRTLATAGIVGTGAYLSWALHPDIWRMHLLTGAAVLGLVLVAVTLWRRRGRSAFAAVLVLGTALAVTYQTDRLPLSTDGGGDPVEVAISISQVEEATSVYQGPVLQLADLFSLSTATSEHTGELLFGNESLMTGHESVVRYSGMSFEEFSEALCLDYRGMVCPAALDNVWRPVAPTGAPLIDLLKVRTLVLATNLFPEQAAGPPPEGWSVADRSEIRTVWVRDEPLPYGGRLAWASPEIGVESVRAGADAETVLFTAEEGGTLVFARLAWPGYSATVDGRPVDVEDGPAGLLTIDVPAGDHVLEVRFVSPGLSLGFRLFVVAVASTLCHTAGWVLVGRRRRRVPPGPPADVRTVLPSDDVQVRGDVVSADRS